MSGGCDIGTAGVGFISALRPSRSHHVRTPAGDFNISLHAVSQSGCLCTPGLPSGIYAGRSHKFPDLFSSSTLASILGKFVTSRTRNATSFGAQRGAGNKPLPFHSIVGSTRVSSDYLKSFAI